MGQEPCVDHRDLTIDVHQRAGPKPVQELVAVRRLEDLAEGVVRMPLGEPLRHHQ